MKRIAFSAAALLAASVTIANSESHDQLPGSVKARQGLMQNYAFSLGTLGGMAKGETAYDAEMAQAAADRLVALSALPQAGLWPEGTSSDEVMGSRALPAIWENMEDFTADFKTLNEAATAMAEVAGTGQEALGPQMGALGKSCGGCHEEYRMSDN